MNCLFCKKEIPDYSKFCLYCGRKQERNTHRYPNGSGTVYKRGQTYTVKVVKYSDGEKHELTKGGFKTKKEARDYAETLRRDMELHRTDRISFAGLWELVQKTSRFQNLSIDKQRAWKYAYAKCSKIHNVKDMREVRYENLQEVMEGLSYYPARDVKILLNAMYTLALKYEYVDKNYATLLELPKLEKTEKEVFTDLELKKIADAQDPFKAYVLIMCYTGLRPTEMACLRREDIHLEERYMYGGKKTELGKASKIAIPETVVPYLENFTPWEVTYNAFYERFHDFLKAVSVRDLTPGCCRHTFVSRLSKVCNNIAVIQKAARHTKYQTTLGYTHMPMDDVLAEVNKLS